MKKRDDPGTPVMASMAATDGVDPSCSYKWEWLVKKDIYLLKLNLPADLKLEDFLVRVDGKRRLTITDRHKPTPGKELRLNKTFRFQLPKTANPDAITGCLNGVVLTLTVPSVRKRRPQPQPQQPAAAAAGAATAKEEEPKAKAELERNLIDTAVAAKEEEPEREKELIDTAVAAFTLGVLFSHRLFSSRNQQ